MAPSSVLKCFAEYTMACVKFRTHRVTERSKSQIPFPAVTPVLELWKIVWKGPGEVM